MVKPREKRPVFNYKDFQFIQLWFLNVVKKQCKNYQTQPKMVCLITQLEKFYAFVAGSI